MDLYLANAQNYRLVFAAKDTTSVFQAVFLLDMDFWCLIVAYGAYTRIRYPHCTFQISNRQGPKEGLYSIGIRLHEFR